jgi:tripartite-type tricarboxylate transporter receptor subunit TctC
MYLKGLRAVVVVGFLAVLAASPGRSLAQTSPQSWPQRPVKFIVPFGPGAGADIGARLLAERLPARWGKPLVIENRPGGDGLVAIQAFSPSRWSWRLPTEPIVTLMSMSTLPFA